MLEGTEQVGTPSIIHLGHLLWGLLRVEAVELQGGRKP